MDRGGAIRLAAAAAVSAAALWLASRNAHVDGVRAALSGARFLWLLPYPIICIVLNILALRGRDQTSILDSATVTAPAKPAAPAAPALPVGPSVPKPQ